MKFSVALSKIGSRKRPPLWVLGVYVLVALIQSPLLEALPLGTVVTGPGVSVFPTLVAGSPGTLLADMTSAYSFTTTAGTTSGTIESAVYRESGGTLDFYYQIANFASSATTLKRDADTDFTMPLVVAIGYRPDGSTLAGTNFMNGTQVPSTVDRSLSSSVVGFNFDISPAQISPGLVTAVLIIATNATAYGAGNAAVIDGGSATVVAFGPASVPEPGSVILTLSGVLALITIRCFVAARQRSKA